MPRDIDSTLLARYFAGGCSAEEEARILSWMDEGPVRKEYVRRLQKLWEMAEERPRHWDVDAAWKEMGRLVGSSPDRRRSRRAIRPSTDRRRLRRVRRHTGLPRALQYAALVAVAVLVTLVIVQPREESASEIPAPKEKMFVTQRGQRATIELTDGTRVYLNADSRLVLAAGFSTGKRTVRLEGEAYFEVARDTTRPFLVRTPSVTVAVLGTAFDVQAYAGEANVQVAVAEGSVALRPERSATAQQDTAVVLTRRHLGVVSEAGVEAVHREVDLSRYLAWTQGKLIFADAPFQEVARRLERWYDLSIEVRIPPAAIDALYATFDDEPVRNVLSEIALALNLQYEKKGRRVIFYRPNLSATTPTAAPAR